MATSAYAELSRFYNGLPAFLKLPGSSKIARPAHVYSLHLQYYVVVILLHRPFLRRDHHENADHDSTSEMAFHHNEVCTYAAQKVSAIMRAYRSHYTLRTIPISTVHAVGTASIIQLLGATSADPSISGNAVRLLKFNLSCLEEMSRAWSWSLRAIRSLQLLAEDWAVGEKLSSNSRQPAMRAQKAPSDSFSTAELPAPDYGPLAMPVDDDDSHDWDDHDWGQVEDQWNLDWLMEYNSTDLEGPTANTMIFGRYFWPPSF